VLVQATTESPLETDADTIVVGVFEDEGVAHDIPGGVLMALLDDGEAQRKFKRLAVTHAQGKRFIVVGLGDRTKFDGERARSAAGVVQARAAELSTKTLCWEVPHHVGDEIVHGLVEGTLLRAYRFGRYKRDQDPDEIERLILSAHHDVSGAAHVADVVVRAQNRARDLGNTPGNELTPAALAEYASELAGRLGITATILDEEAIGLGVDEMKMQATAAAHDTVEGDGAGHQREAQVAAPDGAGWHNQNIRAARRAVLSRFVNFF
jgi:leucyl aminopeptidase